MNVSALGLGLALLCAETSAAVAAQPATATLYGQLSGRVAHFSDTRFLGNAVDTRA